MKGHVILMVLLNAIITGLTGTEGDMPVPAGKDLPGAEITRDEVYAGSALWGLINGGADLYHEYGFDRMALQEISWHGEQFRLELYRMNGAQSAFGIYSVSRHGCEESGVVVAGDCLNKYQYQFYSGNYYLSLINYSGSTEASELSAEIGSIIASRAEGVRYILPAFFQHELFMNHIDDIKVIKGILGLQNALPSLAPVFQELDNYQVFFLEIALNDEKADIMLIETCPLWDNEAMAAVESQLGEGGVTGRYGKNQILVIRSEEGGELYNELLQLMPGEAAVR